MLYSFQVYNAVIQPFFMCLIDEMKEKATHEKFKDQFAIQIGKDLFARVVCGISKISLLTLPYYSFLTQKKRAGGRKPYAVCCLGCLNIHWSLAASEMIRNHWVVSGRGTMCLWPI